MTTKELVAATGIPRSTIMKYVKELDAIPIGGSYGYKFPEDAPKWLRAELRKTRGGAQWRKLRKPEKEGR
jgi:hypothetical protein